MPDVFCDIKHNRKKAYKFKDVLVLREHSLFWEQDNFVKWPGYHKYVFFWVELENGYIVGFNENPNNGWSFPIMENNFLEK